MSNRTLADRYNDQDTIIKNAEETKKALKAEIIALGSELVIGDEVDVKVSLSQRSTMDFDLLFKTYGITEEQFKLFSACTKEGKPFEVLKVVPKAGA
jgi:hypothetical protein